MSEAAGASLGIGEGVSLLPHNLLMAGDNHLGDALSIFYDKIFGRKINEDDADFAPIVGVDGARCVEHGNAALDGKAATGAHLCLVTWREGNEKSRGDEAALHGMQHDGLIEIRPQVHACRQRCGVGREGMMRLVDDMNVHDYFKQPLFEVNKTTGQHVGCGLQSDLLTC